MNEGSDGWMDYEELYKACPDFRAYVDRCVKASGQSVEEKLTERTIRDVGDYMAERMEEQSKVTRVDIEKEGNADA